MSNKTKTTLLIDADVLAFEASVVAEESIHWKDELWTVHADMALAKARVINRIVEFQEKLKTENVVLCLSDRANFRRKLNPDYKANRAKSRLPIILRQVKQWIIDELGGVLWANLEADDVISILATDKAMDEETIVVSIDKDFKSVPGIFFDYNKGEYHQPSEEEADNYHLIQTIAGDHTDGYSGVPGVGVVKAQRILEKDGYTWETVVTCYEKAGLSEQDALMNAWMARLLRSDNYCFRTNTIKKLWIPKNYQTKDILEISQRGLSVTGMMDGDDPALYLQSPFAVSQKDLKMAESFTETTTGKEVSL
jgi:DNA polymerase-1